MICTRVQNGQSATTGDSGGNTKRIIECWDSMPSSKADIWKLNCIYN